MSIPERSNRDREWFSLGKSAKDYPKDWIVIPVILAIEREAKGIRNVREESQAKRLPINWRSNKEVIELVRREIKNAKKEEQNIYDKVVTKIVNNALKIEVRVREETAREKNDLMKEFLLDQYGEECKDYEKGCPVCDAWNFYKKRFLVKSKVQKE